VVLAQTHFASLIEALGRPQTWYGPFLALSRERGTLRAKECELGLHFYRGSGSLRSNKGRQASSIAVETKSGSCVGVGVVVAQEEKRFRCTRLR
jgi:hypothetical protein